MDKCIFCEIIQGKAPAFKFWESESHLAFLSIFPNTQGASVVVPKKHLPSNALCLEENELVALTLAAQKVAHILDAKLQVGRTALVYEGYGINHVHAKLFPLHGTSKNEWKPVSSPHKSYFPVYEGYVSSNDGPRANDDDLQKLASFLTNNKEKDTPVVF